MKKSYFCNLLNSCENNCKNIWEVINLILNRQNFKPDSTKILHDDTTITNNNDIVATFNNYFASVTVNISNEILHTDIDFRDYLQD